MVAQFSTGILAHFSISIYTHQRQRTVFALPKFTMPDDKILVLEIVERNGARHQRIEIRNKQIRLARTL